MLKESVKVEEKELKPKRKNKQACSDRVKLEESIALGKDVDSLRNAEQKQHLDELHDGKGLIQL